MVETLIGIASERFPQGEGKTLDNTGQRRIPPERGGNDIACREVVHAIQEVLRLRYALGLGQRQIARSCSISQATVHHYLKRAQAAEITWPVPEDWDDARLEQALFGPSPRRIYETQRPLPDFADLHQELQEHRHLTLQLLWEEYRQNHPDAYSYTRFCELYQRSRDHLDVVLRQEHKAGEKLFVEYQNYRGCASMLLIYT